jgi:hypothetical protein
LHLLLNSHKPVALTPVDFRLLHFNAIALLKALQLNPN